MAVVRTVLGDIEASELGLCYAHEHIIIDRSFASDQNPDFLLDDVARAVAELRRFHADGGRAMVDSMPCDCGRNVHKLAEISRQSGVHIVVPTGLHLAKYYDSGHWGHAYAAEELTELFVTDIEHGIDARDYCGPFVRRTEHRAGVIKVAAGKAFTPREERSFAAAAHAQVRTGAPILTHTEQGELGLEQALQLRREGADLSHVVLSHLDRKPDPDYHREVLRTGVCLEYDSAFRWKEREGNPTLELIVALAEEFPTQLMLGMDAARRSYWNSYDGSPGLSFLLKPFRERLREAGLSDAAWRRLMVENPARAYSFI